MDYTDPGQIIGIIGTLATLIFGFVGIYIPYRKSSRKTIEFVEEVNINLYNSVVKNISDLSIKFKATPIIENVHLLRGFLINVGAQDITPEMVEKKLKVVLNEDSKWLSAEIISKSTNLLTSLDYEQNKLEFQTGLFRHTEYIYFEAVAESSSNKLKTEIKFDHRIANTNKILYKTMNDFSFFDSTKAYFFMFVAIVLFSFVFKVNKIESDDLEVYDTKMGSQYQELIDIFLSKVNTSADSIHLMNIARKLKNGTIIQDKLLIQEKVIEEYSYLHLLIKGKSEFYECPDERKIQFKVSLSLVKLFLLLSLFFALLFFIVNLVNEILRYRKLKPISELLRKEMMKREKNTIANNA